MTSALRVALTFDAEHPDRRHDVGGTRSVIDTLAEREVQATFFVQGRWVESDTPLAKRIVAGGHLVGNHSFYHARMPLLSPEGFRTDVRAAESVIRRRLNVDPRPFFRLPFGSGAPHARQHELLASMGYRHVHWHFEVKEWRSRATVREIRDGVIDGAVAHGDGAVVLLHPWPPVIARALPAIIDGLRERGATFVDVRALDELPDGLPTQTAA